MQMIDKDADTLEGLFENDWDYDLDHDQTLELIKVIFKIFPSSDKIDKSWTPNPNYDLCGVQSVGNMEGTRLLKAMVKYVKKMKLNFADADFQACGDRIIKWLEGLCIEDIHHDVAMAVDDDGDVFSNNDRSTLNDGVELDDKSTKSKDDENICKILCSAFEQSSGKLSANGNGGSTNGEMGDKGCRIIADLLAINTSDIILDIGSGGGLTLTRMQAISKCNLAVGVEVEHMRHILAVNFSKYLMDTIPDSDFRVCFLNEDINASFFSNFDGFSKIFMYDAAFPPETLLGIAERFNASTTVEYLASTCCNLAEFNFDVDYVRKTNSLMARGGEMSHSFYLYKSKHYRTTIPLSEINSRFSEAFEIAESRPRRTHSVSMQMHAFEKSEKPLRSSRVAAILKEKKKEKGEAASKLFNDLKKNNYQVGDVTYGSAFKTKAYEFFNQRALVSAGRSEMDAISSMSLKKSLIAPSFDGNELDGCILVALIYDNREGGKRYEGILYKIATEEFESASVSQLFDRFDHENSMPFDLKDIMKVNDSFD